MIDIPVEQSQLKLTHPEGNIQNPILLNEVNFADITDPQVVEIREFVRREGELVDEYAKGKDPKSPEVMQRINEQFWQTYNGLGPILKREGKNGYLVTAKDNESKLVGLGIVNYFPDKIDPDRVSLYFGRAHEASGQGIGSQILKKQIDILRSLGITSYIARTNKNSMKVYEKTGLNLKELERQENGNVKFLVRL